MIIHPLFINQFKEHRSVTQFRCIAADAKFAILDRYRNFLRAFPVEMQRIEGLDLRPSIGKGGSHSNGGFVIMLTARGDSEKVQPLRPILVSAMLEPDLYIIAVRL